MDNGLICCVVCCRYFFEVVTSDVRGAGTDAAVSLELCGPAGTSSGPWVLDRQVAFGRGQVGTVQSGLWTTGSMQGMH
jgi:hypothetical protein